MEKTNDGIESGNQSELELCEPVQSVFKNRGITKLYKHQEEAIRKIREGKNIVVSAPTSGGKTEIYLSEVVSEAMKGNKSIIIYPTKALSRDQKERFESFSVFGIRSEIYDGDTPKHKRKKIRDDPPHILITNPDMLHHILLNQEFRRFLSNIKFVVIDEVHTYSGTLGAHLHWIIWRLKRFQPNIRFICTSATIGNPEEFCSKLIGEEVSHIKGTSGSSGKKHYRIRIPESGSYLTEVIRTIKESRKKTIVFGNSHSTVERLGLMANKAEINASVYRSGLPQKIRREIEERFKSGEIRVLFSTSALELGMDIGSVDTVILAGFPGTITRFMQRAGRAGRKGQEAEVIFIPRDNPLDYFYVDNRNELMNGEPERCYLESENPDIAEIHLLSSTAEKMLSDDELDEFKKGIMKTLEEKGLVRKWGRHYGATVRSWSMIRSVGLRGSSDSIKIICSEKEIGERALPMANWELFPGAIYLNMGHTYKSEQLDIKERIAKVSRAYGELHSYTQAIREKDIRITERMNLGEFRGFQYGLGKLHVIDSVLGYQEKDLYSGRVKKSMMFEHPIAYEFDTIGMWVDFSEIRDEIDRFSEGLHALEHVSINMSSAITGADPNEVGGLSYPDGRMFIYDGVKGGSGASRIIYENLGLVFKMAKSRLEECDCHSGCPKCILDHMCGNNNRYLDKESAKEISEILEERE